MPGIRTPQFHAFTTKSDRLLNRIVTPVRVCAAFDPKNPPLPLPTAVDVAALWDTGATASVISSDVAAQLGLVPVGSVEVRHAGGKGISDRYMINVLLPNQTGVAGVVATAFQPELGDITFIVGMDIICQGDLSLTHVGGKSCMSFRTPSCEAIDYVAQANGIISAAMKTGRNEPCGCGSGRKYKHCHGSPQTGVP